MGLISKIRAKVRKLMAAPITQDMTTPVTGQQNLWKQMYTNKSPWLTKNIKSMNLAATLAAEISRMVTLEIKSGVDDGEVDAIYQREVIKGLRTHIEYGLALGGIIFKPYTSGDTVRVDIAQPSDFTILNAASDGTITEVLFKDYLKYDNSWYVRLEHHLFSEAAMSYLIRNTVHKSNESGEIKEPLSSYAHIEPWAEILPELELQNITAPLFGYYKPAVSNNIDTKSPIGVSVYARAVDIIEMADKQLSGLLREFRVKEAKQYVSSLAVKNPEKPLPYLEDDYYIKLNTAGGKAGGGEDFFESYSPEIYVDAYLTGLNEFKKQIEDCIGLAHGTISNVELMSKTATEVMMSKQRTYILITENQKSLREALENTVYAIGVWLKYPTAPPEYAVVTEFSDSFITDQEAEMKSMFGDVEAGLIRPEMYIAKKYGVTEEEARAMMPQSEGLLRE